MTSYEAAAGAVGAQADADLATAAGMLTSAQAQVATLTTQLGDANRQIAADAVVIADLQAQLAGQPQPTTTLGVLGTSNGTIGTARAMTKYAPHVFRAFGPGDMSGVKPGTPVCYSNDRGHGRGYDLDGATFGSAAFNAWTAELKANLRDDAPHFVIWAHEEDIHGSSVSKTTTATQAAAGLARLTRVYAGGRLVVDELNKTRTHKIRTVVCTTGMPYDTVDYRRYNLPGADVIGIDNYARKHWDTVDAWAKSIGKPWCAPETGIQAQPDPTKYTDDEQLASINADAPSWAKALFVTYWIGGGNDLENKPKSAARLQALIAASPVLV